MLVEGEGGSFVYRSDQFCLLSSLFQVCWPILQSPTTAHCIPYPIPVSSGLLAMLPAATLPLVESRFSIGQLRGAGTTQDIVRGWSCL